MLVVSKWLCAVSLQGSRPGQCDEATAHSLLDTFVQAGGNFIDTADVYQFGLSEAIIGNWLMKNPDLRPRMVIATKVWGPLDKDDPNGRGLSRHHIHNAVEQSLRRLRTDYIDLYQVKGCVSGCCSCYTGASTAGLRLLWVMSLASQCVSLCTGLLCVDLMKPCLTVNVCTVYLVFNQVFVAKHHEIISVVSDDNVNVCRWCVILIMVNVGEFYDKITNIQCTLCQRSMYFLYFLSSRHTAGMMALQ